MIRIELFFRFCTRRRAGRATRLDTMYTFQLSLASHVHLASVCSRIARPAGLVARDEDTKPVWTSRSRSVAVRARNHDGFKCYAYLHTIRPVRMHRLNCVDRHWTLVANCLSFWHRVNQYLTAGLAGFVLETDCVAIIAFSTR